MSPLAQKRHYLLVFLATTLSCTVVLKLGELQYLELIFAFDFLVLIGLLARNGFQLRVYLPFLEIGKSYAIFMALVFLLSLFALQQDFATSFHDSTFKKPILVTVSRIVELFLDVFYMLYLASLFRENKALCRFGAKVYCWTGIAGCLYSLATLPLNILFDAQLGTYSNIHRFRGFNNEGGSFGSYLVSVLLLMVVSYQRRWMSRRQFIYGMTILIVGFIGAQSKAAFVAVAFLGVIELLWLYRGWRRWAMLTAMFALLLTIGSFLNFQKLVNAYIQGSEAYQKVSLLHANDGNFVMGRVAGAVLAPRMIAARPLLGIGWGNYPLVRDDREYRQGTAFAITSADAPGLGFLDYIVDLGLPLCLYLAWIELKPSHMLRRRATDPWLIGLALAQPVSTWTGAHLNLTHQWIATAFALGLAYQSGSQETPVIERHALQASTTLEG